MEQKVAQEKDGVMFVWIKELQTIPTILDKEWPRTGFLTTGKIYT